MGPVKHVSECSAVRNSPHSTGKVILFWTCSGGLSGGPLTFSDKVKMTKHLSGLGVQQGKESKPEMTYGKGMKTSLLFRVFFKSVYFSVSNKINKYSPTLGIIYITMTPL